MSHTTERSGGVITVSPTNEAEQSALVVISHGLGDTAEGFGMLSCHTLIIPRGFTSFSISSFWTFLISSPVEMTFEFLRT